MPNGSVLTNAFRGSRAGGGGTIADWGYANFDELAYNCVTNASAYGGRSVVGVPIYKAAGHDYSYSVYAGPEVITNGLLVYAANNEGISGEAIGYIDLSQLIQNVATQVSGNTYAIQGPGTVWIKGGPDGAMWDYGFGTVGCPGAQVSPSGPPGGLLGFGWIFASSGNRQGIFDSTGQGNGYGTFDPGSGNTYNISYAVFAFSDLSWNQAQPAVIPPYGSLKATSSGGGAGGVTLQWSVTTNSP